MFCVESLVCVGFKGEMGVVEGDTGVCVESESGVVDGVFVEGETGGMYREIQGVQRQRQVCGCFCVWKDGFSCVCRYWGLNVEGEMVCVCGEMTGV